MNTISKIKLCAAKCFVAIFSLAVFAWPCAAQAEDIGVTVDGVDISAGSGTGWTYADYTLTFTGAGPYVVSGTNTYGEVRLAIDSSVTEVSVTASNLELSNFDFFGCYVDEGQTLNLTLVGTNRFETSNNESAGIIVRQGATLIIDKATGLTDDAACLSVCGGKEASAIGGVYGSAASVGTIDIRGGSIYAYSGAYYSYSAAIGASDGGSFEKILISGGVVVTVGAYDGAGIGSGYESGKGEIEISGGYIEARGGNYASGIGGGYSAGDVTITITGGEVTAYGGYEGAGIGGGEYGNGGTISISGASVEAYGGDDAPGIGAGYAGMGGTLVFEGDVVAKGGSDSRDIGSYNWDAYDHGVIVASPGQYKMQIPFDGVVEGMAVYPCVAGGEYVCEVAASGLKQVAVKAAATDYAVLAYYDTLAEAFAMVENDQSVVLFRASAEDVTTPAGKTVFFYGESYGMAGAFTVGASGSLHLMSGKFKHEPVAAWISQGYHVLANKDADRIDYPYFVRYAEAAVKREKTTVYYDTIADAFKDCIQGDVISLMMSGVVDAIAPAVPGIILDLNGQSVTNDGDQAVYVENVSLTIRDSVGGGRIVATNGRGAYVMNGTLTLESGTIEGATAGVYIDSWWYNNYSGNYEPVVNSVNILGGAVLAADEDTPAISGARHAQIHIVDGTFRGFVSTCIESDTVLAEDKLGRAMLDLAGYTGSSIPVRVFGAPNEGDPMPGVVFASGVGYADSIVPADNQGRTGAAAFDGNGSFVFSAAAGTWKIAFAPVVLTWVDSDGTTPIADIPLDSAPRNSQIVLPYVYRAGKVLVGWDFEGYVYQPNSAFTVAGDTTFKTVWEEVPYTASGSPADPFTIASTADLIALGNLANSDSLVTKMAHVNFKLAANLDLSAVENWSPISVNGGYAWGATFDGADHVISNLKCTGTGYLGLFGYISGGAVKNLTLANVAVSNTVTDTGYTTYRGTGSIAGWMNNGAVVSNCTVSGLVFANYNCCAIAPSVIGTRIVDCDTSACADVIDVDNTYYSEYTLTNACGYCYKDDTIDVIGRAKGNWVKTTYSNYGYEFREEGLEGATIVRKCVPMSGGKYTKFIYTVTAGDEPIVNGRIGLSADTMIGDQDDADLGVIRDTDGKIMGLKMVNTRTDSAIGNDQYNLYFRGVAGCTDATTYWYGAYWGQKGYYQHWMDQLSQETADPDDGVYVFNENGEYDGYKGDDSALCLSWAVNLEPGKTATYACAFGIGEKADPPRWYTDLTLSKSGRTINADAKVTNEAGLKVMLYGTCAPDKLDGEKLFDTQRALGEDDPIDMHGGIDTTGWADGLYVFTFWTVNEYGAMSESKRKPIQIKDGELILDIGGEGYYLIEGEVISEDKEEFNDYTVKVVALGDPTTEYPSVITKDGYFYAVTPKGEYNVIVTAKPSDPLKKPVESIVLIHVENDTQDVRMELSNPSTRSINSKLVDKTALSSQFHGFLVGDLEQVALKLGETKAGDFTLSILGEDADGSAPHADEMRTLGVRGDQFRDISYVTFGFSVSNDVGEVAQDTVPRTATVVLPFLYARSGELEVYRWNDNVGMMESITAVPNANGEYFQIYSDDAVLISIVKGGLYGLAYNLDRHLTVDGVDIGIAQGLGWTCVSNELVFTGSGEYLWRGTNDVPLKSVNVGGAYIQFTSGETQVSITNVMTRPTWLPQGYGWNWNPTTQIGTSYEFDPVAKIVVDKDYPNLYETLDEAVAAADADGRSVVVLRDCAFTALNVSGGRTVTLEGGLTTVTGTLAAITVEAGSTLRVISGTYTFDPTIHVPEGYGVTDNHDGTWTVWGLVKLTLIGNGETDPETNFFNIVSGDNLLGVSTPVSTNGLTFVGWYKDALCKKQQLAEKPIYEDMTLYAGWGYDVTFNAAGGKFEDGSDVKVESILGGSLTFPSVTRTGYSLLGWYNAITNGATQITAITRACTVYARWSADKKPAGGTGYTGTDTPDGGGVNDVKPTGKMPTGDITIPERVDNSADGKAIVSIARGAYTPKQYETKYSAPAIKSVSIPMYVTEIGDYAFYGNAALKKVVFAPAYDYKTGTKVEVYIRNQAFANTAITNVTFPAGGAYKLGQLAFADNAQLKDVWLLGDVTLASLDNTPFRNIGTACGGTTFHLSPKKAADAEFVRALTNGVNMATVEIDEKPAGKVEITSFDASNDPIVATFTLSDDAPWKTVTTDTVSLLYYKDATKISMGEYTQIFATTVEKLEDGSYRAEFPRPEGSAGYFTVCVGD